MNGEQRRTPILNRFYNQYLVNEDSASFIKKVSMRYSTGTLEQLAGFGARTSRRAAVMALGFLADYQSNAVLGRALHDSDRPVRVLADNGIRNLWCRHGTEVQRQRLGVIVRLNASHQYEEAAEQASELIEEAPWIAETWNQRAVALFHLDSFDASANDCTQTLELNPYHFGAAVGMGWCYLELDEAEAALQCFRRALRLNPGLEGVRAQVEYLKRSLGKHTD